MHMQQHVDPWLNAIGRSSADGRAFEGRIQASLQAPLWRLADMWDRDLLPDATPARIPPADEAQVAAVAVLRFRALMLTLSTGTPAQVAAVPELALQVIARCERFGAGQPSSLSALWEGAHTLHTTMIGMIFATSREGREEGKSVLGPFRSLSFVSWALRAAVLAQKVCFRQLQYTSYPLIASHTIHIPRRPTITRQVNCSDKSGYCCAARFPP